MKFLAILTDSFREAKDSKVLHVLFVLSTLVIVFVASLSFKPSTADKTFQQFFNGQIKSGFAKSDPRPVKQSISIGWIQQLHLEKVEQIKGETDSPLGEYALTVVHGLKGTPKRGSDDIPDGNGLPDMFDKQPGKKEGEQKPVVDPEGQLRLAKEDVKHAFQEAVDLDLIEVASIDVLQRPSDSEPDTTRFLVKVAGNSRTLRLWENELTLFFDLVPMRGAGHMLGFQIFMLAQTVIFAGSLAAVLLGVVITSFFIPNMLRKGTVDLLLAKPIHRWALLAYKYIGGLTFIFLSTAYAVGGIWLMLGIRSGLWGLEPLLLIPSITFFFAILYAISTFSAVLTRSPITCILLTFAAWFFFFLVGVTNDLVLAQRSFESAGTVAQDDRWGDGRIAQTITAIHAVTPRTSDLSRLNSLIMYCSYMTGRFSDLNKFNDTNSVWWESLLVSGAWITFFVGASCLWFSRSDY